MRERIVITLCVMLTTLSCGKNEQDDNHDGDEGWGVGTPGHLITRGMYRIDYKMIEDTCKPTTAETRMHPDFLWRERSIIDVSEISDRPGRFTASADLHQIRHDATSLLGYYVTPEGVFEDRIIYEFEYFQTDIATCEGGGTQFFIPNTQRMFAYSEVDNQIRVHVQNDWMGATGQCEPGESSFAVGGGLPMEFVPMEPCVEEYEMTHTLIEECPAECEMDVTWVKKGEGQFARHIIEEEGWCKCPDSSD